MMGALIPPQRGAAVCLLNRGKANGGRWACRQEDCDLGQGCEGNHVGWEGGRIFLTHVHYKNAGKGADFSGAHRAVTIGDAALGRLMTGLLQHQSRWASCMLTSIVEEEDVGALFVHPASGMPFKQSGREHQAGSTTLTSYIRECMDDLQLQLSEDGEGDTPWLPDGMGPREFRFAYVGWFMATSKGKKSGWVDRMKRNLARLMTTTAREWDRTYQQGADANEDMGWAMGQLEQNIAGFQEGDGSDEED